MICDKLKRGNDKSRNSMATDEDDIDVDSREDYKTVMLDLQDDEDDEDESEDVNRARKYIR